MSVATDARPVVGVVEPTRSRRRRNRRLVINLMRLLVVAVLLAAWEFLPKIEALQETSKVFDPFFVSSPSRVFEQMQAMFTGSDGTFQIWDYAWPTIWASLVGTVIGMALGALCALVLSNFEMLSDIFRPFLIAANATPRVALIPIVVILVGPSATATITISVLVVFFVAFFNAYEGGRSVKPELVQNARLLGASQLQIVRTIRFPYVLAWTLASLPLAVTFAVITVVTAEILTGVQGMGKLLSTASTTANATLTYAVVIVLSVLGVVIVVAADLIRARLLHWWAK
ncbi:ABC transporter permease [Nocardioides sediminis]|uniref:ABC transporter permease n=1 Tax=Nocardioides sediminis TaxID=433648 RepID=UPI000D30BD87|nr:ABC transporter permease subunit [Nocardioides sediminis]